ncbi:MAG TPA: glycosyltransferase family 4 protein [Mycobacteriales bacterium]|nr:glycosyltransferase family 4 protein [Mycobacteriales bacterium]
MRVGLVCPYTWDVPGGVQSHVRDLALALTSIGHEVSVLAPAADADAELPPYVVNAGRTVPIRYNGSVARLAFGPRSAKRARRWLADGDFDVLHLHEPFAPSVSLLALWAARGPVVATFHASVVRSRALETLEPALRPALEKIHARIAVSPAARTYVVTHLGGSCLLVPNGVDVSLFAEAEPLPGWPGPHGAVGFLGRIDEPRKGLPVLLEAFGPLAAAHPGLRLLVAGPGDVDEVRADLPGPWAHRVELLGLVSEADKARFFRSVDIYCAPNIGGESFGIVLLEAMAAGAPVVASDLEAFRVTLDGAGALVAPDDPGALAGVLDALLSDPARRAQHAAAGRDVVRRYDWPTVTRQLVEVYETVAGEKVSADRALGRSSGAPA